MSDTQTAPPATADTGAPPPAQTAQTPAQEAPAFDGPEWLSKYPDDVKNDRALWKYQNDEAATRALISAQRMIGMEKVPRPKGDFDPSSPDWEPWLAAMGRPKAADEYKFEEAKLPEGLQYDTNLEGKFKEVAHMAGLTNKQAHMLRDMFASYQASAYSSASTEYKVQRETAEAELQKELGSAYEPYVNAAKAALKQYADDKFVGWLNESGMGNHPEIIRVFGKIGKEMIGESQLATQKEAFNTPGDWKQQAEAYQAQWGHILYNYGHPEQKTRWDEWTRLIERANPS